MDEAVGAVHLHSVYSDGSATVREVTAAARRAGLDFFVLTDHDTDAPLIDGWAGWCDGVLVIPGTEVSCRPPCHVVGLGARGAESLRYRPLEEVVADLAAQGSPAFVAHAHPARIPRILKWPPKPKGLEDWDAPGFVGVELWSLMHDACDGLRLWQAPAFPYTWRRRLTGPHPRTLEQYDAITQRRRFAAVGALDNHAIRVPLAGLQIVPHEDAFRALRTHVLCEPLDGTRQDVGRVTEALVEGRSLIALDLLADARGFRFEGRSGGETIRMGEERPFDAPVALEIESPRPASLRLLRDGVEVASSVGRTLAFTADSPGVHRVEARLDGRPWVFTNPIYLRPEGFVPEEGA